MKNYTQFINEENSKSFFKDYNFNYDGEYDETYNTAYQWFYNFGDKNFRTQLISKNIKDVHSFKMALEANPTLLYDLANEIKKSNLYNRASNNILNTQVGQKLISYLGLNKPKDNFDDCEIKKTNK